MSELENAIIHIIEQNVKLSEQRKELNPSDGLVNVGINSIDFINLIVKLEEKLDVRFEDEFLDIDRFVTISDIAVYIRNRASL